MRFELCPVHAEELKQYKLDMQEAFQKGFENKYGKTDQMVLPEKDIDRSLNTQGAAVYKAVVDGHGVGLFQTAFLTALHRVAIINAGTLYSGYTGFQSVRITEFRTTVRQDIFKHGSEFIGSHTLFQAVKNKTDSAFGASVHQKGEEEFFFGKKHGQ